MWSSPRRILRRDRAGEGMATRARRVGRLVGQHDLGRGARRHGDRDVEASPHWSAARVIPIWPRKPAVGQQHAERVSTGPQGGGDVVGLHLQPGVVLGEPGRELGVADPFAVEERLVQPPCRGVEPGRDDRPVQVELVAEQRGRPTP